MTPLQQYQEDTLKKFEEVLKDSLHYDMDDETGDPLIRGSYWDIREPLKSFLQEALKGQLEVVGEMQNDKVNVLIQKHKDEACVISSSAEYDEVNMTHWIENPIIKRLVFQHIDSVRELSSLTTPLLEEIIK